jgi:methyl-accepting chemotaxis protein
VATAIEAGGEAGRAIGALAETLGEAARASAQIVASSGQQATGMAQISQAMQDLDQVAQRNVAAIRHIEEAAGDLTALSDRLSVIVAAAPAPAREDASGR